MCILIWKVTAALTDNGSLQRIKEEKEYHMKSKIFSDKFFNRQLWKLAVPIMIQSLMLASVAAADAFMLGGVDQNSMSAVSLASQIQFIQNMIISSVTAAVSILGAQYWGKKDKKTIGRIFCLSVRFCFLSSFVFFLGCICVPERLMVLFTNEPELIAIGADYLRIAGWSYLLTGISQCYLVILKVTDHTADAAKISSTAVVLNIILNWILIFGGFGITAMGVQGAALATLIARVTELACCVCLSFRKGYIRLNLAGLWKAYPVLTGDFVRCLLPMIGAALLWGVGFTSYTAFMGHMGTDAAAANSIASVVRDLVCCMCNGLASGGGILVGNELGAGNLSTGREYGDRLMKLSFVCGLLSTAIMFAVTPLLIHVVKLTVQARYHLIGMMCIMAVYMIGRTVNTIVINGIFAAGGDTLFDMYSLVVTMWMIAVPLAALGAFVFHWPVEVVYACTCLDEVGKIPWVIYHYKKYKWVKDLTREMI